jgi:MFS family permease
VLFNLKQSPRPYPCGAESLHECRLLITNADLDRNNIAAARLGGLEEDLSINSTQYATCLSILYVGYILMQVPSNIIINRISRPSWYISAAMLLWGLISTLSGNTHNFAGMVAVRFFIGFVEAAFLPG